MLRSICRFCGDGYEFRLSKLHEREQGLCAPCGRMAIIEKHVNTCASDIEAKLEQVLRATADLSSAVRQVSADVSRLIEGT